MTALAPDTLLPTILKTMSQPGGYYQLPNGNRIERAVSPDGLPVWLVTFERIGIAWWLSHDLIWVCSLSWNSNEDWSRDHGYATPEEAYLTWLNWVDGLEEG